MYHHSLMHVSPQKGQTILCLSRLRLSTVPACSEIIDGEIAEGSIKTGYAYAHDSSKVHDSSKAHDRRELNNRPGSINFLHHSLGNPESLSHPANTFELR